MSITTPIFLPKDAVRDRSERSRVGFVVREPRRYAGEYWYPVQFGAERTELPESRLELYEGGEDLDSLLEQGRFGNKDTFAKCVTFTKLRTPLRNTLYSFRASRTQFHAYQFKPLLKFLDSPRQRLLIADEVGLGKTIEAGFILRELKVRHPTKRVLIVCPSALCRKWQEEMARRFDEEFQILRAEDMRTFLKKVEEQPDRATLQGIIPLQSLRAKAFLEVFEANKPLLDLVIVDEAHHMRNSGTLSNKLGGLLSECAYAMLLMTATPIHLGNENLFQLLRILDPEEFDRVDLFERRVQVNQIILEADRALRHRGDPKECKGLLLSLRETVESDRFEKNPYYQDLLIKLEACDPTRRESLVDIQQDLARINLLSHILTRTRKREVNEARPKRDPGVIPVQFSPDEFAFYQQTTDLCIAWYEKKGADWAARFAALSLQRQVASCLPAFIEHNLVPEAILPANAAEELSDLQLEDWGLDQEVSASDLLQSCNRLADEPAFQRILRTHHKLNLGDSKYDALLDKLRKLDQAEPGRKLMIFSYFKKTLAYLSRRLEKDGYHCLILSGDIPSKPSDPENDERGKRVLAFREDPKIQILISSEVGSEGLDFQFCHILFNYDLPWNPMVVEQRIGRLDRLGQQSERILIFNFSVKGTIEEQILDRLYSRIGIFEGSIGDLEPILGEEIRHLTEALLKSRLSDEEREQIIERRAEVLARKRVEADQLEEGSRKFLGQDEFFTEQISRVETYRRYLSPEEIQVFVTGYLKDSHPRCTLQAAKQAGCYWLTVTKELEQAVRRSSVGDDSSVQEFLTRSDQGGMLVTFDSQASCEHPQAILQNIQHPLVRTIVAYYKDNPDRVHPVSKLQVVCPEVPESDYFYQLQLLEISGAERGRYLDPVFLPVEGGPALDPDHSHLLLSRMLVEGFDLPDELDVPPDLLAALRGAMVDEVSSRITERRAHLEKRNAALVESRLASLSGSYATRKAKHMALLEKAELMNKKENYLRMLRGGLRNIEADYERRKIDLDESRQLDLQLQRFALGFVRVYADERKQP